MKRLLFSSLSLFLGAAVFAQQIRLPDAVSIALKNSLEIQVAKDNLQISDLGNSFGFAGGLPVVTATGSDNEQSVNIKQKISQKINGVDTSYNIIRNGAASNQLSGSAGGSILLYNGLRVHATKKRLEELVKQNQQLLNSQ